MSNLGIGERLKNARQARGLSLEDIEAATRIRRRYLEALEDEAFDHLPAPVYVKGFLGGYATYLGFSSDEIQAMYHDLDTLVHQGETPVDVRITPVTPRSRVRRTALILSLIVMVAAYFSYVAYIQFRQFAATPAGQVPAAAPGSVSASAPAAGTPAPPNQAVPPPTVSGTGAAAVPSTLSGSAADTAPPAVSGSAAAGGPSTASASGQMPPAPVFTVSASAPSTVSADAPTPTVPAPPPMVVAGPVVVTVDASDRSWVRAVADGVTVFEGFLSAGDHQVWQANHQLSLRVGNASAVTVTVDGQSVGRLGNPGDVVDRVFTAAAR